MASLSSLEMKAMLAHTEELTTALSTSPLSTVGLLLDKNFVQSEVQDKVMVDKTREGKAAILVEAVTHEVETYPDKLEIFLQILSEQTWTKEVGERLRSTYQSHQRSVALVSYHTPVQSAYNQPQQSVCDQNLQDKQTAYTVPNAAAKSSEQTLIEKDVVTLLNLLHNYSDKWFEIGLELGFAPSELNLIRNMPLLLNDAPVSYLTKLLSQWVQWPTAQHPTKPTLGMLCKALRTSLVGLGSLADEVQENMKSLRASLTPNPDHQKVHLDLKVAAEIEDFEDQFRKLHRNTRLELINGSTDTKEVLEALTLLPLKLKSEYENAIQSMLPTLSCQQGVNELFLHLNPLLSFIDYGLLEYIIKVFCSNNLKDDMRSYRNDMQTFMEQTTIEQLIGHIPGQHQIPKTFSLLEAKIGQDAGKCTLKKVNAIRVRYCGEVKLSKIIFHLVAITRSNSFIVRWGVPSVIVADLIASTRTIERSFFQENAIISLSLNKTWLYDETTSTTIAQFSSLREQTRFELSESKRSVEDLALCLAQKLTSLEKVDSVHLIELILKKSLLSVADFEILNFIVQKFGSDNLKEKMQTYVDGITLSAKQITVHKMMDLMPDRPECPENFVPIECRIVEEPSHYTLDRVLSLQEKFLSDMKIHKLTLLSVNFQNPRISGSFSVSWLVPINQASQLMSLNQVESDLFLREKIASLSIGSKLLYYSKLFEFGAQLKIQYQQFQMGKSPFEWLSSTPRKVFRLALIHGEKLREWQKKDKFVQMSISSRVDDILHAKTPVKLEDLFRSERHGSKIILIEGSPSSGRTSLTTHIIHKWAQGELFKEFTLVILVQLGDPAVQRAQSISDLLPCQNVKLTKKLAAELEATNGRGVLWILDGWEELRPHLQEDSIFHKLLPPKSTNRHKERLLTDSSVIVTSRPISAGDLHPVVSSRVEILGLHPEEQRQYFTECLKGDTKSLELFLEKIEDNLIIQRTCYLPANAALTVHYFKVKNHSVPSSEYELFCTTIINCIQHHLEKESKEHVLPTQLKSLSELLGNESIGGLFRELCRLAYHGMAKKKVTFSSSELPQGPNTLGLLREIESFLEGGKSVFYSFLHHPLQELLAAVHIATSLPDNEQVFQFQQLFHQPHYVGVFQFYSAITKLETPGMDKAVVEMFSCDSEPLSQRMHLLRCLHEAQNRSICLQLLVNKCYYFSNLEYPLNLLSIGYFISISNNDQVLTVHLSSVGLGDNGVKHLTKYLCDSSSPYSLAQGANPKQLAGWEFSMDGNYIDEDGAACIAKVLQSSHVMNSLDLSCNEIGGKGLQSICQALITNTSLVELNLSFCKLVISEENGPVVSEMLQKNKTLEELKLSENPGISDTGMFYIAEGLQKNTSLKTLKMSHINEKGGKALATAIASNTSLSLDKLDLDNLEITEDSGPAWVDMLKQNTFLESISILLKSPSDIGVSFIAKGLQINTSLKTLRLRRSEITSVGAMYLSKMLMVNKSLTSFNFSFNPIGDKGLAHLAESLKENKTLEDLDIDCCNITDTGLASLTDALCTNNSLDTLYLSYNDALTEKGVRPLLHVCKRIRYVNVVLPYHLSEEYGHIQLGLTNEKNEVSVEVTLKKLARIKQHFAKLLKDVASKFRSRELNFEAFHFFIVNLFPPGKCIPQLENVIKIFEAVTQNGLWSYWHYSPVETIIKEYAPNDDEMKSWLDNYRKDLSGYKATTKVADAIKIYSNSSEEFEETDRTLRPPTTRDPTYLRCLTVKLKPSVTEKTLVYIDDLWISLAEYFLLPSLSVLLYKITRGCVEVSWLIPPHYVIQIVGNYLQENAAFWQFKGIVKVLLDGECVYDGAQEEEFRQKLVDAVSKGDIDEMVELLASGIDINITLEEGWTAVMIACNNGCLNVVHLLVEKQANVCLKNKTGHTCLMVACKNGHLDVVRFLLSLPQVDVNARDGNGFSALMHVSRSGNIEIFKSLLKHPKVDINATSNDGYTALILACYHGHVEISELLLSQHADTNIRDKSGWTVLTFSCMGGSVETVKLILSYEMDPNTQDEDGWTPLMVATSYNFPKVVQELLNSGANPNIKNNAGETALMIAHKSENHGVIELLKDCTQVEVSIPPAETTRTDSKGDEHSFQSGPVVGARPGVDIIEFREMVERGPESRDAPKPHSHRSPWQQHQHGPNLPEPQ